MSYTIVLSPEHQRFLRDLFGENVSFAEKALRVYASDASLMQGEPLAADAPRLHREAC